MLKKFSEYQWEGIELLKYKEDKNLFRDVTRQVLFHSAPDIPCEWRYFEVGPGGYSTLEHHQHTHWVMIIQGSGRCLLGDRIEEVAFGDCIEIPAWQWHQFRATNHEPLGFLCLVNQQRDKVTLPTDEDLAELKKNLEIKEILEAE